MQVGQDIELDISGVAHGGVFVARHEGRVVFVSDAIPGERVRARLTDVSKPSFWRADTIEVLAPSTHRRPHVWPAADVATPPAARPGGADFGHIALDEQRRLKAAVLRDALHRFGGLDEVTVTVQPADGAPSQPAAGEAAETTDGTGWRTRVSLHVDDRGQVGPYAARSHRVVPVRDLPLATAEVAAAARALTGDVPGRIDLVQPSDGRVRVLVRPALPARGRRERLGEPAGAREVVVQRVGERSFRVDAGGFWQVHRLAASALSREVSAALREAGGVDPDAAHLDLYGGVGLFATVLGDLGGPGAHITSVESDERATEHAGENLAEWVGARAETDRVDRWLARRVAQASAHERDRLARGVAVLDPPRAGAGRAVVEALTALAPPVVVYVACDPVALARDIATFRQRGYELTRLAAMDLFPSSHHVEAVATLSRGAARLTP